MQVPNNIPLLDANGAPQYYKISYSILFDRLNSLRKRQAFNCVFQTVVNQITVSTVSISQINIGTPFPVITSTFTLTTVTVITQQLVCQPGSAFPIILVPGIVLIPTVPDPNPPVISTPLLPSSSSAPVVPSSSSTSIVPSSNSVPAVPSSSSTPVAPSSSSIPILPSSSSTPVVLSSSSTPVVPSSSSVAVSSQVSSAAVTSSAAPSNTPPSSTTSSASSTSSMAGPLCTAYQIPGGTEATDATVCADSWARSISGVTQIARTGYSTLEHCAVLCRSLQCDYLVLDWWTYECVMYAGALTWTPGSPSTGDLYLPFDIRCFGFAPICGYGNPTSPSATPALPASSSSPLVISSSSNAPPTSSIVAVTSSAPPPSTVQSSTAVPTSSGTSTQCVVSWYSI